MNTCLIRGRILSFNRAPESAKDVNSYKYIENGALLIINGKISSVSDFTEISSNDTKNMTIYDHRPNLVVPGFIDTHLHFSQVQLIGSYASNLFEWLNKYTFIEEQKYKDLRHGERMAKFFLTN